MLACSGCRAQGVGLGIAVNEMQRSVGLGDVPNDFEAASDLQYTPVRQGWYYGFPINGGRYPREFGDTATPSSTQDLTQVAKYQRASTILQAIATLSIATIASITVARVIHVKRRGRDFFEEK